MFILFQVIGLYAISYAAYRLLEAVKFPAARLIGPILCIGLIQALSGHTFEIPTVLKTAFSVVFGVYLGLRFHRKAVHTLRASALPAALISFIYLGLTLAYGELIQTISPLDQTTAFLAVIPGGIAEASILGVSYNADLAQISAFQLVRFLSIVLIVPLTVTWLLRHKERTLPAQEEEFIEPEVLNETPQETMAGPSHTKAKRHWIWLMVIGTIGGFLLKAVNFPAAYMLGATFFVSGAILCQPHTFKKPPQTYYNLAQVGMGLVIGTSFTPTAVKTMGSLIYPMLLLTVLVLVSSFMLGYLFMKLFKWDFLTAFFSVLPGGMSAMVVLADEFDSDVITISSLQLVRLLTAVMIIPLIYHFLL